ncbi:MAG: hypothetical protein QG623_44 [Patescibacteria group bacterium]|nr:hypothetical protein [Patescibacteria group bacterium]
MIELVNPVGCKVESFLITDLSGVGAKHKNGLLKSAFFEQLEQSSAKIDDHTNYFLQRVVSHRTRLIKLK